MDRIDDRIHEGTKNTKNMVLNSSQKLDPTSDQFKGYVEDLNASFDQQQAKYETYLADQAKIENFKDLSLQKSESVQHTTREGSTVQDGLPAIKIDNSVTQSTAEETDKVEEDIIFHAKSFDVENGLRSEWQRPRSKSLEPGAIEDFYPIKMESSEIYSGSGTGSKGFLGFSLNSKFLGLVKAAATSSDGSELLKVSSKTLKPQEDSAVSTNTTLFSGETFNKSFSGYAKRVPTSPAQSTAGLTLLQSAAVSQGIIAEPSKKESKKNHTRNNTALSAYEITPSEALSSSKIYTLDDFEVIRKVGKGGFARVFLVQQKKSNRKYYALKCVKKADIIRLKQERQIMNEKNILKTFKHNFIVDLFHTFQTQKFLFMTMEFVPGGDLYSLMKKNKGFTEEVARFYAAEVLIAIEYLHSIRIVYRDLKPENILLDATGHIKLADFGFARILNGKTKSFCGTPDYIAWEIVANKEYTHSVDWWSLGVLIFELVAGKTPFRAKSSDLIYENVIELNIQWTPAILGLCKDIIQKLLVTNPTFRLGHRLGSPEIKMHMWFASLNWKKIAMRQVSPPIIPNVNDQAVQSVVKPAEDPNEEFQEYLNDSNTDMEKRQAEIIDSEVDPFKDF